MHGSFAHTEMFCRSSQTSSSGSLSQVEKNIYCFFDGVDCSMSASVHRAPYDSDRVCYAQPPDEVAELGSATVLYYA